MIFNSYRICPQNSLSYVIKPGDSYYKIAMQFNTTISVIAALNPQVNPLNLTVDQTICVPVKGPVPACPEGNYYVVKPGNTLYSIARFFNISLYDLMEANPGVNPNVIFIGQVICIPLAVSSPNCPPGIFSYIVMAGDTFYSIGRLFGVTTQELIIANKAVNPNALLIGQKLCIPKIGHKYISEEFNVNFLYPIDWRRVSNDRYEGSDGFFQVGAMSGKSLEEVCQSEANHILKPYGSQPIIVRTLVDGSPGCFIFPYSDQPPEMRGQAALTLTYFKPVVISGTSYNFFILWADKSHIREIGNTLTFLTR